MRNRRGQIGRVVRQLGAHVAAFRGVDAPQVANALAVLGVLADGDVHHSFVDHRRGDDVVARAAAAEKHPDGVFGVGVELPQQLRSAVSIAGRVKAVDPAVAAGEDRLRLAPEHRIGRARPLPVQDVLARRGVGPQQLAGVLVEGDEARGVGRGQVDVRLIEPVRGVHQQDVARGRNAATAHVVLRHAQLAHHVEHPDDIRLDFGRVLFTGDWSVVFAVAEAFRVEAAHLAAAGDEPELLALHERRAADPLQRPIVNAAGLELLRRVLPEELSVIDVERDQAAEVDFRWVALDPPAGVVGADKRLAAGDDHVAVGLRTEPRHPLDVLRAGGVPLAGAEIKIADIPTRGDVLADRHVVPLGRAEELVPLERRAEGGRNRRLARRRGDGVPPGACKSKHAHQQRDDAERQPVRTMAGL